MEGENERETNLRGEPIPVAETVGGEAAAAGEGEANV